MNTLRSLLYLLAVVLLAAACSNSQPASDASAESNTTRLGEIDFAVTGSPEAVPHFERGLLLLHSFEYEDAREAFLQAQETDSGLAMAYWGEAMTYNHSLWREQDFEKGRKALQKLAPTPEDRQLQAGTELERDLLQAVDILYGVGEKKERDRAYAAAMEKLYQKHPDSHEVAAFYALSLLGAVPVGRDEEAYGKGANVAKGILAENPNHPGALHYLIHSYDDPGHARLALDAADNYAEVAPDAAHALHMPSHIYVAMGMWNEVVASNIDSWQASLNRMERKGLDNNARNYHALHWLMYGYLQQGQNEKALELLQDMARYCEELPSKRARGYLVHMKGNYLVETDEWTSPAAGLAPGQMDDLNIVNRGIFFFLEGMKAYHAGDTDALAAAIDTLEQQRTQASYLVSEDGLPMCGAAGANRSAPNQLDIQQAEVMEMQLRGLLARQQGNGEQAGEWLQKAARLEDDLSYSYGPPDIVKPSHELYGEWLLENDRPQEAMARFEYALERGPKRQRALRGQLRAARALGDTELAAKIEKTLEEIRQTAQTGTAAAEQLSGR